MSHSHCGQPDHSAGKCTPRKFMIHGSGGTDSQIQGQAAGILRKDVNVFVSRFHESTSDLLVFSLRELRHYGRFTNSGTGEGADGQLGESSESGWNSPEA